MARDGRKASRKLGILHAVKHGGGVATDNNLAALSIYLMSWLSDMVVKIPYLSVETLPWSWLDCLMWYVAWFAFFALLTRHLPRREFIHVREWEKGDD